MLETNQKNGCKHFLMFTLHIPSLFSLFSIVLADGATGLTAPAQTIGLLGSAPARLSTFRPKRGNRIHRHSQFYFRFTSELAPQAPFPSPLLPSSMGAYLLHGVLFVGSLPVEQHRPFCQCALLTRCHIMFDGTLVPSNIGAAFAALALMNKIAQ